MAVIVQYAEDNRRPIPSNYYKKLLNAVKSDLPEVNVTKVFKVIYANRYSHAAFQIKKAEFEITYGYDCPTKMLYHATKADMVSSILQNNLDWRKVSRCRYGAGVSFSDSPSYANTHCNRLIGPHRAFIVCDVLIGNDRKVHANYNKVPNHEDVQTYRSNTEKVVVKFEDDTFYPRYVVYYNTNNTYYFNSKWINNALKYN